MDGGDFYFACNKTHILTFNCIYGHPHNVARYIATLCRFVAGLLLTSNTRPHKTLTISDLRTPTNILHRKMIVI